MTEILLTDCEFKWAIDLANTRMFAGNEQKLRHATTYQRTYLERFMEEVVGVCGELAAAKHCGAFWSPTFNTFHRVADVANMEVRATRRANGRLIVRQRELEDGLGDRWFVLVTGEPPAMTIRGGIRGYDAKRDEWVDDPNGWGKPAYFVPQDALIPPKESR